MLLSLHIFVPSGEICVQSLDTYVCMFASRGTRPVALARLSLAWSPPSRPRRSRAARALPLGAAGAGLRAPPPPDDRVDPRFRRHSWRRPLAGPRPPHAARRACVLSGTTPCVGHPFLSYPSDGSPRLWGGGRVPRARREIRHIFLPALSATPPSPQGRRLSVRRHTHRAGIEPGKVPGRQRLAGPRVLVP